LYWGQWRAMERVQIVSVASVEPWESECFVFHLTGFPGHCMQTRNAFFSDTPCRICIIPRRRCCPGEPESDQVHGTPFLPIWDFV
jgi:hypothetical protein